MRRARTTLAVTVLGVGVALGAPGPAAALKLERCGQAGFGCATIAVPLDRSGAVPGTVRLRVALQTGRRARSRPRVLVALSGGPGQGGVDFAQTFALSLEPALSRYRLAVIDQRGTGRSGALDCPQVQRLRGLDAIRADQVAACAERIGPRRAFYATQDSVADIEALRQALGVRRIALMGISYGTFVAQQYARVHPERVSALILDSVVAGDALDPFMRDSLARLPRILSEQCARRACRGITRDPVADVAALAARLSAGRPVTGFVYDSRGRRRASAYRGAEELFALLIAGDLNQYLQPALPAAIRAAVRGDPALLLRLRRIADGPPTPLRDLSFGLNVITVCEDAKLPYALTTPLAQRPALAQQAAAALTPAEVAPFDAGTALAAGYVEDCLRFPEAVTRPPSSAPLPDVPALLLGGRLDVRTPLENARDVARELPRAQVVAVPGGGHDELDTDLTGCAQEALRRFVRGRRVGTPCDGGLSNALPPLPLPPRALADFPRAPGVRGDRGRTIAAVLDTVLDAQISAAQVLHAGFRGDPRGGGLHGGSFRETPAGTIILRRYGYMRGLRVTGRLRTAASGELAGRLRVRGPRGSSGVLRLRADGGVSGRLDGRGVRVRPSRGSAAGRLPLQVARAAGRARRSR
jgi:pimeloyl-ACP methyl ester carboxylesterase